MSAISADNIKKAYIKANENSYVSKGELDNLEEAIKWYEDKETEYKILSKEDEDFAMMVAHYQQLAGWLRELKLLRCGDDWMKLGKRNTNIPILNEEWVVDFYDHKSLSFTNRQDLEKYLNHELSEEHGYMEYERVPSGVTHVVHYDIDWDYDIDWE